RFVHMFQHFHADHDIEFTCQIGGQIMAGDQTVVDVEAGLFGVGAGGCNQRFGQIQTRDRGAASRYGFAENAGPAADVEHAGAIELAALVDVVQAQRVDVVQWPHVAVGVPPAVGKGA